MSTKKRRPRPRQHEEEEATVAVSSNVKGIIAIMITALVVIIVVMLFAKSLFVSTETTEKQTGRLTTPPNYTTVTTTTTEEVTTTKKKKTTKATTEADEDPYKDNMLNSGATDMTVKSAVYLHPEPNSSSANLATLPAGANVKAYAIVNGQWLYVDYNGQKGYAYYTFFNGTVPTATSVPS